MSSTTPNAQLNNEVAGQKRAKRRNKAAEALRIGKSANEQPKIWAIRFLDDNDNGGGDVDKISERPQTGRSHPVDGTSARFGVNLFSSEEKARKVIRSFNKDAHLRSFHTLPSAIKWAKAEATPRDEHSGELAKIAAKTLASMEVAKPKAAEGDESQLGVRVGDTWLSPAFPDVESVPEEQTIVIEVQAHRTMHKQTKQLFVGFDAWFDGERKLSERSDLAGPTVSRAVLEGCIRALKKWREDYSSTKKLVYLNSPSILPYLAVCGRRKGMPAGCASLAVSLARMCEELPVAVTISHPMDE